MPMPYCMRVSPAISQKPRNVPAMFWRVAGSRISVNEIMYWSRSSVVMDGNVSLPVNWIKLFRLWR